MLVGSAPSSARVLVVVSLMVETANAVAGLHTNEVTIVLCCSALDFAASAQSRSAHASPASTAVDAIDNNPAGPFVVMFAKNAASALRARSRTRPSPTTCSAAGLESAASSALMTTGPASFGGVMVTSVRVGSAAEISPPSATQAATGSANTTGMRSECESTLQTLIAVALALAKVCGANLTLGDLVRCDEKITLTTDLSVTDDELQGFLAGREVSVEHRHLGEVIDSAKDALARRKGWPQRLQKLPMGPQRQIRHDYDEPEQLLERNLGLDRDRLIAEMAALWGRVIQRRTRPSAPGRAPTRRRRAARPVNSSPNSRGCSMATISRYQNTSGATRYRVRYRTPERGQTQRRGFKTKRDAEAFAATVEVSKLKGEYVAPALGRVSVDELATDWLARKKQATAPSHYRMLEPTYRTHVRPQWGCGQRGDVDTLGIEAWIAAMVSGATTVLRADGVLSGMLADAVKAGLPPTRPRVSKTCRARRPSVMSTCRPMTYTG